MSTVGELTCSTSRNPGNPKNHNTRSRTLFWNISNVLRGSSNGTRTSAISLHTEQPHVVFPALQVLCSDYRSLYKEHSYITNSKDRERSSHIYGRSATYRSTVVPLFKPHNQMFYRNSVDTRPLSRTPSLGAVVSTRPNTYIERKQKQTTQTSTS